MLRKKLLNPRVAKKHTYIYLLYIYIVLLIYIYVYIYIKSQMVNKIGPPNSFYFFFKHLMGIDLFCMKFVVRVQTLKLGKVKRL